MKRYYLVILMLALPLILVSLRVLSLRAIQHPGWGCDRGRHGRSHRPGYWRQHREHSDRAGCRNHPRALVGNAVDQDYQAARDAAQYNKPVIYYDRNGRAVEAVPAASTDPNCRKITKRIWRMGNWSKRRLKKSVSPRRSVTTLRRRHLHPIITTVGDGPQLFILLWAALLRRLLRVSSLHHYHGWHRW